MESVLLKAKLVNLSTGQYWLNFDGQKGMSDREGHGHKAVLYKSHFPPLRHQLLERHHCIHRLINHVYYQRTKPFVIHCSMTLWKHWSSHIRHSLSHHMRTFGPLDWKDINHLQWRIQDFPEEGALTPKGGCHPIIWLIFADNCMKMKKFWAGGARVPRAPP